ncbi:MAG TPA: transcription elongation factor GreA [Tetrasphaera sp.]|uniref:Transcription elongation factor GreA n=1 Tax=Nostocoides vanveenii TaxID=330835 RepID=A0ABP4XDT2_9MICO|nr:transcription elongation factor GreA [Tetrasphaera sp.]HNQ06851.1 transcription elongation factor GreA [Tetrasphaera sp.]
MSEPTTTSTFLTQEAYERLSSELQELSGPRRAEVIGRIEAARAEGDLKENGGYHAAKEEQGKLELRIRQLTQLLATAVIGTPPDDGVVEPGMLVTVELFGEDETFLLGSRESADGDLQVFSEASPLGSAINGLRVGDTTSYQAPNGKTIEVTIKAAKPFTG